MQFWNTIFSDFYRKWHLAEVRIYGWYTTLYAPYTNITKSDIARIGKQLDIDYTETWSCYKGGTHHCGKCGTCQERKEALAEAGITDKTIYLE